MRAGMTASHRASAHACLQVLLPSLVSLCLGMHVVMAIVARYKCTGPISCLWPGHRKHIHALVVACVSVWLRQLVIRPHRMLAWVSQCASRTWYRWCWGWCSFFGAQARHWAEINKENRGSTKAFIKSKPESQLLIALVTMQLTATFLCRVEKIADQKWDLQQWHAYSTTGSSSSRMLEAHSGRLEEATMADADMYFGPDAWDALPQLHRTWLSAGLHASMQPARVKYLHIGVRIDNCFVCLFKTNIPFWI
jgi:hypothetical protein